MQINGPVPTQTVCLHHNDADGRAAAAVVRRAYNGQTATIEMNYGDAVPWDRIAPAKRVIVVDFSLPLEEMQQLEQGRELTWIDHHVSAIRLLGEAARTWQGLQDTNEAACVLTWQYYFPNQPVPRALVLIGDRDVWRWAEVDTGPFDAGLQQEDTAPDNDDLWLPLLRNDPALLHRLIERGTILRAAQLNDIQRRLSGYGFPVIFEGQRTLAINTRGNGDMGAAIGALNYTLGYCYIDGMQNGRLMTFVTLFSSQVDVSRIAQKFGGGGHPGAAGFSFERRDSPFPPGSDVEYLSG
jgi:oligoribonuclease NrnB/cAMP/cGMP phosphodiesterase (DHH superfamily)